MSEANQVGQPGALNKSRSTLIPRAASASKWLTLSASSTTSTRLYWCLTLAPEGMILRGLFYVWHP